MPSVSVIFCVALKVSKQYHGQARALVGAALPANGAPVPGRRNRPHDVGDAGADGFDGAPASCPSRNEEPSLMPPLAVVESCGRPAGDDVDHHLAWSGIGDDDVDQLDGLLLGP